MDVHHTPASQWRRALQARDDDVALWFRAERSRSIHSCWIALVRPWTWAAGSTWAALALPGDQKVGVDDPREMERLASALTAEQAASRWIVSTDPAEIVERVGTYADMGFDHLVIHGPGADQERFITLFAKDVLPRLRARA